MLPSHYAKILEGRAVAVPAPPVVAAPILGHRAPSSASTHNILSPLTDTAQSLQAGREAAIPDTGEVPDRDDQVQLSPGFTKLSSHLLYTDLSLNTSPPGQDRP